MSDEPTTDRERRLATRLGNLVRNANEAITQAIGETKKQERKRLLKLLTAAEAMTEAFERQYPDHRPNELSDLEDVINEVKEEIGDE